MGRLAASWSRPTQSGDTLEVHEKLPAVGRFRSIEWIDETGSTNADLAARARAEGAVPAVLVAELQTAGRGRRDRRWEMPAGGGVLMSALVPRPDDGAPGRITMALAVATVDALRHLGAEVAVKWPNDIVAQDDRKLGGMLAELTPVGGSGPPGEAVVAGLGLNITWPSADRTDLPGAVALADLIGREVDRRNLVLALVERFDAELAHLDNDVGWGRYRARLATLGRTVRIETDTETVVGRAADITADGALVLEHGRGRDVYTAADVHHLRPGLDSSP